MGIPRSGVRGTGHVRHPVNRAIRKTVRYCAEPEHPQGRVNNRAFACLPGTMVRVLDMKAELPNCSCSSMSSGPALDDRSGTNPVTGPAFKERTGPAPPRMRSDREICVLVSLFVWASGTYPSPAEGLMINGIGRIMPGSG